MENETLYQIWLPDSESWDYTVSSFDENDYPDGYVAYAVVSEDGVIVQDELHHPNVGREFSEVYDRTLWFN